MNSENFTDPLDYFRKIQEIIVKEFGTNVSFDHLEIWSDETYCKWDERYNDFENDIQLYDIDFYLNSDWNQFNYDPEDVANKVIKRTRQKWLEENLKAIKEKEEKEKLEKERKEKQDYNQYLRLKEKFEGK